MNVLKKAPRGISVVEVMVALAVFSVVSTVGYQVFIQSNDILKQKHLEHQALWLAEEGVEVAYAIGRNDFEDLTEGTWGLSDTSGQWELSGSEDMVDNFTRSVSISDLDQDTKEVVSNVVWSYKDVSRTTTLQTELTNWHQEVEPVGDKLIVNTASAYILATTVGGIYLQTELTEPVVIDKIQVAWTKNSRTLRSMQSPALMTIFGPANANSGDINDIANITIISGTNRQLLLYFNRNMNNSDFTLTFVFDDASTQTVQINGL